jgi:HPt (histidine-containing phosphotransfer) domain-containing protein
MLSIEKVTFETIHRDVPEMFRASVDLDVLRSYEKIQLDGEPDLIVELIDLYLEDARRRLAVMKLSVTQRNWLSLNREAHSVRGSSGNLGALKMALICDEIEGLESRDPFAIEALLACLEQELEQVLHIFLAERQRRLQ